MSSAELKTYIETLEKQIEHISKEQQLDNERALKFAEQKQALEKKIVEGLLEDYEVTKGWEETGFKNKEDVLLWKCKNERQVLEKKVGEQRIALNCETCCGHREKEIRQQSLEDVDNILQELLQREGERNDPKLSAYSQSIRTVAYSQAIRNVIEELNKLKEKCKYSDYQTLQKKVELASKIRQQTLDDVVGLDIKIKKHVISSSDEYMLIEMQEFNKLRENE